MIFTNSQTYFDDVASLYYKYTHTSRIGPLILEIFLEVLSLYQRKIETISTRIF